MNLENFHKTVNEMYRTGAPMSLSGSMCAKLKKAII